MYLICNYSFILNFHALGHHKTHKINDVE